MWAKVVPDGKVLDEFPKEATLPSLPQQVRHVEQQPLWRQVKVSLFAHKYIFKASLTNPLTSMNYLYKLATWINKKEHHKCYC